MGKRTLLGYSHAFLVAADDHAARARQQGVAGEVDGMMCVIALQNAVVGATKLLGDSHPAVTECLTRTPDLKHVRDMLTHFDDYGMGTGKLQKSLDGSDGPFGWTPMWNSPETIVILTRRKGEKVATHYEVAIHDALQAVAVLVGKAAEFLNVERGAFLERLTVTAR
jgi:hypothetical protein